MVNFITIDRENARELTMTTRILLADKYQIVCQGLRALLEKETGLEVVGEAASGPAVLRQVQDLAPDIVILDLALPGLQGVEAIRQILAASPHIKIIALSIYADRRFVVNILKAGASGYLLKDCAFEELIKAIRTVQEPKTFISPGLSDIVAQDYIEALRHSEARFRTIFEATTMGIALVDKDGRIGECNPALQQMLGYSLTEIVNQVFTVFILPDDASRCMALFRELVQGHQDSYQVEKKYIRKDGRTAWGRLNVSLIRGVKVEDHLAICMIEDITEPKQAEKAIRTYQEQLRSVASELSLTEERERRRLATELHDHVGQILALAQIKLGAIRESASSTQLAEPMDEVRRLIEQTIQYTRSLTFELSPPILYDLGFEAAVEWLAELIQKQQGITVKVQADRSAKPMDDEIRVILFQTVRELLGNVVKHASAKNIRVFIAREDAALQVKIEDDGLGMGISADAANGPFGFGFFSIGERLRYLGGRLEVVSEPGWGTRVTLQVPLKY
ncbi:MAG: PAS domain S-box protein [Deltaproteobacteria bacterium]|nr:PAS domain S-box protein [Deltaproteobacteria bacterium]